ncbi:MAG TPA: hypothetical protein PLA50_08815, partial [Bacteroidia bacterium]|nr:hypothetical protein [Bacteroidia bacterium]
LEVKWKGGDPASGLVEALAMPDRTVSVEVRPVRSAGRSLFRVSWPEGESVQESRMEHDARSLDVSNRLGMTRRFEWDTDTGRILSDGVNSYDVAVGEGGSSTVRMVNASGEEQTRRYDNAGNAIVPTDSSARSTGFPMPSPALPASPASSSVRATRPES